MDIYDLYIQKTLESEDNKQEIKFKTLKELFISDININNISRIIYRELYLPNNQELFDEIRNKINNLAQIWINTFNNNKFNNDLNDQLRYTNSLFISYYKSEFLKNKDYKEHEIQNNPYKHIYSSNSKKKNHNEILASDYNFITFNNYNDKYTTNSQFTNSYNKIPYYEKSLYTKHLDRFDNGSFRERNLINTNHKKYNNNDLFNNINYLR